MARRMEGVALATADPVLGAHMADLSARATGTAVLSRFLTGREARITAAAAAAGGYAHHLFFWGGAKGAIRRAAVFLPDWLDVWEAPADPLSPEREEWLREAVSAGMDGGTVSASVVAVKLTGSGYETLGHRDWLGALMALGIRRDVLGDVFVLDGHTAGVIADAVMADFIVGNLTSAGRDTVRAALWELPRDWEIPRRYTPVTGTVASARLDGVLKVLLRLSRGDASELITGGMVELNDFPVTEADTEIRDGDELTVRGFGRFAVETVGAVTKKGRERLVARQYI